MIGFVYLWMDSGRHSSSHPNRRMFVLGSHFGSEHDGYTTGTGGQRFKNAYQKRPQDFKRRIIERIYEGNGRTVLNAEQRWLDMIKPEELNRRYYNSKKTANGFSREDLLQLHLENPDIGKRISKGIRDRYKAEPELGVRNGAKLKAAFASDPSYGERASAARLASYAADPTRAKRQGAAIRDKTQQTPQSTCVGVKALD